jgi:hypothetical protein
MAQQQEDDNGTTIGGRQWHNNRRTNMVIMAGGKSIVAMSGERLGRLILTNRKAVLIVILRSLKGDVRIYRTASKKPRILKFK